MLKHIVYAAAVSMLVIPAAAQSQSARSERVQFARGASSHTIRGSIRGNAVNDYTVTARAGQTMTVTLQTSNASSFFDVTAPRASRPMFVGTSGGNHFNRRLTVSGDYRIRVYLTRNAARRNERANFTLSITLSGQGAGWPQDSGAPIVRGNMIAFCRNQAAHRFSVRLGSIQTGGISTTAGGSWIDGAARRGVRATQRFRCRFDTRNRFIDVMPH